MRYYLQHGLWWLKNDKPVDPWHTHFLLFQYTKPSISGGLNDYDSWAIPKYGTSPSQFERSPINVNSKTRACNPWLQRIDISFFCEEMAVDSGTESPTRSATVIPATNIGHVGLNQWPSNRLTQQLPFLSATKSGSRLDVKSPVSQYHSRDHHAWRREPKRFRWNPTFLGSIPHGGLVKGQFLVGSVPTAVVQTWLSSFSNWGWVICYLWNYQLGESRSIQRRRSSGGACRPAKEGPFPFDDCQDWVQGPG